MNARAPEVNAQLQQLVARRLAQAASAELVETGLGQLLVVLAEATTNARAAGLPLGTQHDLAILDDVAKRAQRAAKHYRLRQLRKAYAKEHHHGS